MILYFNLFCFDGVFFLTPSCETRRRMQIAGQLCVATNTGLWEFSSLVHSRTQFQLQKLGYARRQTASTCSVGQLLTLSPCLSLVLLALNQLWGWSRVHERLLFSSCFSFFFFLFFLSWVSSLVTGSWRVSTLLSRAEHSSPKHKSRVLHKMRAT